MLLHDFVGDGRTKNPSFGRKGCKNLNLLKEFVDGYSKVVISKFYNDLSIIGLKNRRRNSKLIANYGMSGALE